MIGNAARGARRFRADCVARVLLAAFCLLLTIPASAQAQSVDWLVNIDDAGFDPFPAGGTIQYVVDVDNNGFDTAPATTIDLDVFPGASLVGISGDFTNCRVGAVPLATPLTGPATVTCDVPSLASLASASSVVGIVAPAAGVIDLTATVPTAGDDLPGNNTLTEQTTITAGADLAIALTLPPTASSGSRIPFSVDVTNNGPNTASAFTIDFPIPAGLVNITGPGGGPLPAGCSIVAGAIRCNVAGSLATAASLARSFEGQVSAAGGSTVTGSASVINSVPEDPISSNNTDTRNMSVTGGTDVAIDITQSGGGSLLVGDTSIFTISSSYTGDSPTGLTITTTIPSSYSIDSITSPDGWACTVAPGTQDVTCTLASGSGPGANVDLGDIFITTTALTPGSPAVSATISATSPVETNLANNTDTVAATITAPTVDLDANKTSQFPATAVVGESHAYRISVTNQGNAGFFGTLVMTDTLPAGVTVNSYTLNGWTCTPAAPVAGPATIECTRVYTAAAPLAAGATSPVVVLNYTATAPGTLVNSMTVSAINPNIPDTNPANDTASASVVVSDPAGAADLTVLKTATLASVQVGDIQTFRIEVVNTGPATATSARMTDILSNLINNGVGPTGQGFIGVTTTPGVATGIACTTTPNGATARRLTCDIGTLPVCTPGFDCPVFDVQVRPGGNGGARTNTADVLSLDTPDPNRTNQSASASYTTTPATDVTVLKSANPNPARAGQDVTFVVTARTVSNGLSAAENVTITDTLPDDMTFLSATPSSGTCSGVPANGTVTSGTSFSCNLGTIPNGAQRTVTILARPNSATIGTTLTNTVTVTTTTPEIDVQPNSAAASVDVIDADVDLLINKSDSIDPVTVGETTVYTLTVTNAGPSASQNIVVTDVLPASVFAYRSHTVPADGTCTTVPVNTGNGNPPPAAAADRTLTCSFPYLEAGASRVITITAQATAKGTVANNVSISSDEIVAGSDRLAGNNQTSETTTARTRADVEVVSKVADIDPIDLLRPFNFTITVRNNAGPLLAEADNVIVRDTLPAGMLLTGPPSVTSGAASVTATTCTGAAGGTSFQCDLGTFASGGVVQITVPVQVVTSTGGPITNTATIETSSFDSNPGNNSNSGTVAVRVSSLGGTVYRDFNDSATPAASGQDLPSDTGVSGITMTLIGTAFDGTPITRTVTTDANGDYLFSGLPEGSYRVERGAVADPRLVTGQNTIGSEGGTIASPTLIQTIALPPSTDAVDYDFALIPQASIGIAKDQVGATIVGPDGSFEATFRLLVENLSSEPLVNIAVTDALEGPAPDFGTHVAALAGAPGTYTISAAPSGTCGGLNAGFTGAGSPVVASGFGLAVGATCTIDFAVRVQPAVPLPPVLPSGGRYENQAGVTGEGGLSGQTPATNPLLSDLSDDGADPDANGNGDATGPGENDPTPVLPAFAPAIALVKTADTSALNDPVQVGDVITYTFAVTNTGNVALTNVTVAETLIGATVIGGPIASLAPGATDATTITATYPVTLADINAGQVVNSATATGTDPFGTPVTDTSGATVGDDAPTVTPLVPRPAITLVKTADTSGLGTPPLPGDVITYAFRIENTGNVTLSNVTVTDTLPGIVLAGGPIASLAPGAVDAATFTASYTLTPADIAAGQVINLAQVTGTPPAGPNVTDTDTVTVPIAQVPALEATKTQVLTDNGDGVDGVGDTLTYTITVENIGNAPVSGLTLADTLTDRNGAGLTLTTGPTFVGASLGSGAGNLLPGEIATYTATFVVDPQAVQAGGTSNTVTATGTPGFGGAAVSDVSDDGIDTDGNVVDDPTEYAFPLAARIAGVTLTKTTPLGIVRRGDIVPYTITIDNVNAFAIGPFDLVDTLPPGFVFVPGSAAPAGAVAAGQQVTWPGISVPPASSLVLTLNARILPGARPGEHVNVATLRDPISGAPLLQAQATVRILPEAVFDCADVIGKVFTDRNGNGYQDPEQVGAISDQNLFVGGKYSTKLSPAAEEADTTEGGIPGVRLAGVDGTIITTDEHGRFSVPCAMLPETRGSNFILKLDPRSLPPGYRVTTENPRVVRLTPGMLTEMNFGATLGKVVRIDLASEAFPGGQMSAALTQGIAGLLPQIANDAGLVLRLTFVVPQAATDADLGAARAQLRTVERHVRAEWRRVGNTRLVIEQQIVRAGP